MKRYLVLVVLVIAISACDDTDSNETGSSLVTGKNYVGEPVNIEYCSMPEQPEGCGNPGFFDFISDTTVDYAWRGSDMIFRSAYYEDSGKVYIEDFSMTIIDGGIEIVDDTYGLHFRDEDYPWD